MKRFIGIDIGGTKCAVILGNASGATIDRHQFSTPVGPEATLEKLMEITRLFAATQGTISAIGISCGGPLDAANGVVLSPPNLPGWDAVPVTAFFSERLGAPAFLQNDANACALAEWRHGAGRGSRHMMFCTMGTGFGCGLILDGKLHEGTNGNAGELGHVRLTPDGPVGYGKPGSVEGWCSGGGIAQLSRLRLDEHEAAGGTSFLTAAEPLTAKNVAEAAQRGDELALRIYGEVGEKLGQALALSIDMLNLERVVVGSIFARSERLLRPAMERVLREECLAPALSACTIRAAELGERIGDMAALTVAQNGWEQSTP